MAVTLQTYLWDVFSFESCWDISYPEGFHGFPYSLKANARIVPWLCHDNHLLPNPFQFIICLSAYHAVLYSPATDSAVK
jgi:hypothetical protein